jgi:hypothetical protein
MAEALAITADEAATPDPPRALAWDVYLLYPPGERDILAPAQWFHQLPIQRVPRLDPAELRRAIEALLLKPQT